MNPGLRPLMFLLLAMPALAADDEDLAKITEQELEEVREQISEIKQSIDTAAARRDAVTAELQEAEVTISEKRLRLKELERERAKKGH